MRRLKKKKKTKLRRIEHIRVFIIRFLLLSSLTAIFCNERTNFGDGTKKKINKFWSIEKSYNRLLIDQFNCFTCRKTRTRFFFALFCVFFLFGQNYSNFETIKLYKMDMSHTLKWKCLVLIYMHVVVWFLWLKTWIVIRVKQLNS